MNRLLALFLVAAPLVARAAPAEISRQPALPSATPWTAPIPSLSLAPSGLQIITLSRRALPLVHLSALVQAGADLDPEGRPGLACATAMMLQDGGAGARLAPAVAEAIDALGSQLTVTCDKTGVRLALTVLSTNLDRALALLADLIAHPRFDGEEWTRARARRLAEIIRDRDEPRTIADLVFERALYGDKAYGRPQLGTPAALAKITIEDIRAFYAAHYGPKTSALILVGDVADGEAARRADKVFGSWRSNAAPGPILAAIPPAPARLILVDRPGAPQSEIRIGHVGLAAATPDYAAASLLETVLGGSFTSRLNQNLREKHGYTYGVTARFVWLRAPGPFVARTAVRTDVTAESVKEILVELANIRAPLAVAEIGKGRSLVEAGLIESFGDGALASRLIGDLVALNLGLDLYARLPAALAALDIASLAQAVPRLFKSDLVIVVVGDRKKIEAPLRALPLGKNLEVVDVDGLPVK